MAAGIADLIIQQGETFTRYLTLVGPAPTSAPIDISTYTFRGQIRANAQATEVLANFTFSFPNGGTDGVVAMSLTDTETSALPATGTKYSSYTKVQYDVEMEDASGNVTRLLNGQISISPEVTK